MLLIFHHKITFLNGFRSYQLGMELKIATMTIRIIMAKPAFMSGDMNHMKWVRIRRRFLFHFLLILIQMSGLKLHGKQIDLYSERTI